MFHALSLPRVRLWPGCCFTLPASCSAILCWSHGWLGPRRGVWMKGADDRHSVYLSLHLVFTRAPFSSSPCLRLDRNAFISLTGSQIYILVVGRLVDCRQRACGFVKTASLKSHSCRLSAKRCRRLYSSLLRFQCDALISQLGSPGGNQVNADCPDVHRLGVNFNASAVQFAGEKGDYDLMPS